MTNILNYEMIFAAGLFLSLLLLMLGGLLNTVKKMSIREEKIWSAVVLFLAVGSSVGMATIYGIFGDKLDLAHLESKKTTSRVMLLQECQNMKTMVCQEKWYRYRADSLRLELEVMKNEKTKL